MGKPEWLQNRERYRRFPHCVNCAVGGQICGETNYIPGVGRLPMYRCNKHPSVVFYKGSLACEHYEPRR